MTRRRRKRKPDRKRSSGKKQGFPLVHTRALRRRKPDIVGLWHNVGYMVAGDTLTVTLGGALENDLQTRRPRFSITLCPKKLLAWRTNTSTPAPASPPRPRTAPACAAPAAAAPPPPAPIDRLIEQVTGLRLPAGRFRLFQMSPGAP